MNVKIERSVTVSKRNPGSGHNECHAQIGDGSCFQLCPNRLKGSRGRLWHLARKESGQRSTSQKFNYLFHNEYNYARSVLFMSTIHKSVQDVFALTAP